ncbi:MAG: sigma-70 family RNA polymerase sigma factor [Planctomycetota bacterium]
MNPEDLLAHRDFVRALAKSLVLDQHGAEDIAQQTWVAALEHPPDPGRPAMPWLARLVRNFSKKLRRSEVRRTRREHAGAVRESVPSAEQIAEREETRRCIIDAVSSLDEPYRSVILLRYYECLPPRRIASSLGIPVDTARTRIKRGLAQLRARLDQLYGDRSTWVSALAPVAGLRVAGATAASTVATLAGASIMTAKMKLGILLAAVVLAAGVLLWIGIAAGPRELTSSTPGRTASSAAPRPVGQELQPEMELLQRESLVGGARVCGTVVDAATDEALSGAIVIVAVASGEHDSLVTQSAEDGRFESEMLGWSGSGWVVVRSSGYNERAVACAIPQNGTLDLGIVALFAAWELTGTVVDSSGSAVAGARVIAQRTESFFVDDRSAYRTITWESTSDLEGPFRIAARSGHPGKVPEHVRAEKEESGSVWLPVTLSEPMLLRLTPVREVRGRLVWSLDGSPVDGAIVRPLMGGIESRTLVAKTTDSQGAFVLSGLPLQDLELGIYVCNPGNPRWPPDLRVAVSAELRDLGTIRIDGPTGVDVRVCEAGSGCGVADVLVMYGSVRHYSMGSCRTDGSGRARTDDLPARVFIAISLRKPGYGGWGARAEACVIETGEPGGIASLVLEMTKDGSLQPELTRSAFAGLVRDSRGAPVPAAYVCFNVRGLPRDGANWADLLARPSPSSGFQAEGWTDANGSFSLETKFTRGIHAIESVSVHNPNYPPLWVDGAELDVDHLDQFAFVLQDPGAWFDVAVCSAGNQPLANALVTLAYDISGPERGRLVACYSRATDSRGACVVPRIAGVPFECTVECEGYETHHTSGVGAGPGVVPLRIALGERRTWQFDLRCLTSGGLPVRGVDIDPFVTRREDYVAPVETGADGIGRFVLERDRPLLVDAHYYAVSRITGSVWAYSTRRLLYPAPQENVVTLPAGQPLEVVLVFDRGYDPSRIDRLKLPSGTAVQLLSEPSGERHSLLDTHDRDGERWPSSSARFRWGSGQIPAVAVRRFVPVGRYRIAVTSPGFSDRVLEPVEIIDSQAVLEKVVHLEPGQ